MSNQKSGNHHQYPGHYDHEALLDLMKQSGHNPRTLAKKARKSKTTIAEAMVGECKKFDTLWDINKALGGKWECLFKNVD